MARFGDIVAYQYRADLYCPNCIVQQVTINHSILRSASAEVALDCLAIERKIDREDERTFDSGEFPKVVLYDHLHDQGETFYCGNCHNELEA